MIILSPLLDNYGALSLDFSLREVPLPPSGLHQLSLPGPGEGAVTRAGGGRGHHRAGGYHIQVGVEERDAVGGGEEVLTRVVEGGGGLASLAGHLDSQGESQASWSVGPHVNPRLLLSSILFIENDLNDFKIKTFPKR